jgi:hypothetical protein
LHAAGTVAALGQWVMSVGPDACIVRPYVDHHPANNNQTE